MPVMVMAEFDTPYFRFIAFGSSRQHCRNLLARAWRVHCRETGADHNYFDGDGINYTDAVPGSVCRDGQQIIGPKTRKERTK